VAAYERELAETGNVAAENFKKSVKSSKSRTVCPGSSHTVSFYRQVIACTLREYWLARGDMLSFWVTIWTNIIITLLVGAQFWNQKDDTTGVFMKGGSTYFAVIFLGWIRMSEIVGAVLGRDVVQRHKNYALVCLTFLLYWDHLF
jgi:ATP-binding cassette, subfamily G (WHITE), member 2, SNQ2